jgi:hypothetical protein
MIRQPPRAARSQPQVEIVPARAILAAHQGQRPVLVADRVLGDVGDLDDSERVVAVEVARLGNRLSDADCAAIAAAHRRLTSCRPITHS